MKAAAGETPVFVGSGATVETLGELLPHADGFIVGTAFKSGGVESPVDVARVRTFMRRIAEAS